MAPTTSGEGLSAQRARFAGPSGLKGIIASGKTSGIAFFASLGGFVYGYNQGMFAQVLTMQSFINRVSNIFPRSSVSALRLIRHLDRLKVSLLPPALIKVF